MEEKWKTVKGYEKLYEVSNLGNIKSLDCYINQKNKSKALKKGKILKTYTSKQNGYVYITFNRNKKIRTFKVHRLVAEHFIDNPYSLPQVNHIDGNKENNCVR